MIECKIYFIWDSCSIPSPKAINVYYKSDCDSDEAFVPLSEDDYRVIEQKPTYGNGEINLFRSVGCYMLEIQCAECLTPATFILEVNECCPFEYTTEISPATCHPDGSIDLEITGVGNPPFEFAWSDDSSLSDLNDVHGGMYTVTVTDFYGCTEVITEEIPTCCCEQSFSLSSTDVTVDDVIYNDIYLSSLSSFSFPYVGSGGLSLLVSDMNSFENSMGGYVTLTGSDILISSCSQYHYLYGKYMTDTTCQNGFVTSVESSCLESTPPICDLEMELIAVADCLMEATVSDNSGYFINLQYFNEETNLWETVAPVIGNFTAFTGYIAGTYRLAAGTFDSCPDLYSCSIDYGCCMCDISEILLAGDYLNDGEFCLGVDSLGFTVLLSGCDKFAVVELLLPDSTIIVVPETTEGVYKVFITDSLGFEASGSYGFTVVDESGCMGDSTLMFEVENCSVCEDCPIDIRIASNKPSSISVSVLTMQDTTICGDVDQYVISWYHNVVSDSTKLFTSGNLSGLPHPLTNFPVPGGAIIPVLDTIMIDSVIFTQDYPGTFGCLDTVLVENYSCGSGTFFYHYDYSTDDNSDIRFNMEIDSSTNFIKIKFEGYFVPDTIKITYSDTILLYAVVGDDIGGGNDITSSPILYKGGYYDHYLVYFIDSENIYNGVDSLLEISVRGNRMNLSTEWDLRIFCVDEITCGNLGEPNFDSTTCNIVESVSGLCSYSINVPIVNSITPYTHSRVISRYTSKIPIAVRFDRCDLKYRNVGSTPEYCDLDSLKLQRIGDDVIIQVLGNSDFYSVLKQKILDSLNVSNYGATCSYEGDINYYKHFRLYFYGKILCDPPSGDGNTNNDYYIEFYVHSCPDNFIFNDSEKRITITLQEVENYELNENQCLDCYDFINTRFVNLINNDYQNFYPNDSLIYSKALIWKEKFRFIQRQNINNGYASIRYYDFAAQECSEDCGTYDEIRLRLVIDDMEDGCNNFSLYWDSEKCDGMTNYDSLVYQVSGGNTLVAKIDPADFANFSEITEDSGDYPIPLDSGEVTEQELRVYPNPAYQMLNVEYHTQQPDKGVLSILDRNGRLVSSQEWQTDYGSNIIQLDMEAMNGGLYFIHYQDSQHSSYKKFILINQ